MWIKWWSVEDIEVDSVNIGRVDVGMEHDFLLLHLFFRLGGIGRRVILRRYLRQSAFYHQYALAHKRVELDFLVP